MFQYFAEYHVIKWLPQRFRNFIFNNIKSKQIGNLKFVFDKLDRLLINIDSYAKGGFF
jgi:hypothetical protein